MLLLITDYFHRLVGLLQTASQIITLNAIFKNGYYSSSNYFSSFNPQYINLCCDKIKLQTWSLQIRHITSYISDWDLYLVSILPKSTTFIYIDSK